MSSPEAFSTPKNCLLTRLSWEWIIYNIRPIIGNLKNLGYEIEVLDSVLSIQGFTHKLPEIISDMADEIRDRGEETSILSKKNVFNNLIQQNLLSERELESNYPFRQGKTHLVKLLIKNDCDLEAMEKEAGKLKIEEYF
jgi:hypothetical protein